MEVIAVVLFGVAALGGLILALQHFKKSSLSLPLALLHGLFAASGLILLLLSVIGGAASANAGIALGLFVVAALGGFFLFSHHLRSKPLPSPVVVIHALAAVGAFLLLVVGLLLSS